MLRYFPIEDKDFFQIYFRITLFALTPLGQIFTPEFFATIFTQIGNKSPNLLLILCLTWPGWLCVCIWLPMCARSVAPPAYPPPATPPPTHSLVASSSLSSFMGKITEGGWIKAKNNLAFSADSVQRGVKSPERGKIRSLIGLNSISVQEGCFLASKMCRAKWSHFNTPPRLARAGHACGNFFNLGPTQPENEGKVICRENLMANNFYFLSVKNPPNFATIMRRVAKKTTMQISTRAGHLN